MQTRPTIRQCALTGERKPVSALLRFAWDGAQVIPDPRAILPGRGIWLTATRQAVEEACAKRVFARRSRGRWTKWHNLPDAAAAALDAQCLTRLSHYLMAGMELSVASATSQPDALIIAPGAAGQEGIPCWKWSGEGLSPSLQTRIPNNFVHLGVKSSIVRADLLGKSGIAATERLINAIHRRWLFDDTNESTGPNE